MQFNKLKKTWENLGESNALWAVLSDNKNWNNDEFFKTGYTEIDKIFKEVKRLNIIIPINKALDFGCGVGRITQALGKKFNTVIGVDISETMIKQANVYNKFDNIEFILNEKEDLSLFNDNEFDFIYSNIVLQHMDNKYSKNYIKEFIRIISKKGLIVFQIPSEPAWTWKGILIKILPTQILIKLRKGMEMNPIKKDDLLKFIENNGGQVIDVVKDDHKHWNSYFYYIKK